MKNGLTFSKDLNYLIPSRVCVFISRNQLCPASTDSDVSWMKLEITMNNEAESWSHLMECKVFGSDNGLASFASLKIMIF